MKEVDVAYYVKYTNKTSKSIITIVAPFELDGDDHASRNGEKQ